MGRRRVVDLGARLAVVAFVVGAMAGVSAFVSAAPAVSPAATCSTGGAGASVSESPCDGLVRSNVTAGYSGFTCGPSGGHYEWDSSGVSAGTIDPAGGTTTVTVPTNDLPGGHTLQAWCDSLAAPPTLEASVAFTVDPPQLTLTPPTGPPGTAFTVVTNGWPASCAPVTYYWGPPGSATVLNTLPSAPADGTGFATSVPSGAGASAIAANQVSAECQPVGAVGLPPVDASSPYNVTATLVLTPATGGPGTAFTGTGAGYAGCTSPTLTWDVPVVTSAPGTVSGTNANIPFTAPGGSSSGSHSVTSSCTNPGGSVVQLASASFAVPAAPPAPTTTTTAPPRTTTTVPPRTTTTLAPTTTSTPATTAPTTTSPPTTSPPTTSTPTTSPSTTSPRTTSPPATSPPATAPPTTGPPTTPSTTSTTIVPNQPGQPSTPPTSGAPAASPPGPTLQLDRLSIEPGSQVTARGDGCVPGAPVTLTLNGVTVAETVADADGHFTTPLAIAQLAVGRYQVQAVCGVTLQAPLDVVLASQVDQGTSTLAVILFFLLLGLALFRRQLRLG